MLQTWTYYPVPKGLGLMAMLPGKAPAPSLPPAEPAPGLLTDSAASQAGALQQAW